MPEAARKIIKEQLNLKSNKVPWLDNHAFSKLVISQQIKDYNDALADVVFYDRAIPDVIAYLNYYKQQMHLDEFLVHADKYRYSNKVFLLPPWQEIYEKDEERTETFEESALINEELIKSYKALNYEIIEVPFDNSTERAKFILEQTSR